MARVMADPAGVRARNRAEVTEAILAAGRQQLAEVGAAALSLRAVARATGMVSSAVYRYVANRDELLTLLIVDSFDSLGAAVEGAASRRPPGTARRFVAAAAAIRSWALTHPHEYALLYGSPVPGYAAPELTVAHASRTTRVLVDVVVEAARTGTLQPMPSTAAGLRRPRLSRDLARVRAFAIEALDGAECVEVGELLDDDRLIALVMAWTQLFGLVSFELFGQLANTVDHPAQLFDVTMGATARLLGLE